MLIKKHLINFLIILFHMKLKSSLDYNMKNLLLLNRTINLSIIRTLHSKNWVKQVIFGLKNQ